MDYFRNWREHVSELGLFSFFSSLFLLSRFEPRVDPNERPSGFFYLHHVHSSCVYSCLPSTFSRLFSHWRSIFGSFLARSGIFASARVYLSKASWLFTAVGRWPMDFGESSDSCLCLNQVIVYCGGRAFPPPFVVFYATQSKKKCLDEFMNAFSLFTFIS